MDFKQWAKNETKQLKAKTLIHLRLFGKNGQKKDITEAVCQVMKY